MEPTPEERVLAMLEETQGCRILNIVRHDNKEAYVFAQDTPEGVRTYGYCIPRENGESWGYFPQKDTYMLSEEQIMKLVTKDAIQVFKDEKKEELAQVENKFNVDDEDSTEQTAD